MSSHAHPSVAGSVRLWVRAVRPFSFTASLVPVFLGAAVAADLGMESHWALVPLVALCALLFHVGANLVCDYFDYAKGVDREGTFGGSGVLTEGLMSAQRVYAGGLASFAAGCALGLVLVALRGWPMLALGAVGMAGGYAYSGGPKGFKYWAAGDVGIFLLFGPLLVAGAVFALAGVFSWQAVWIALPVGFLVAAIVFVNNLRDIRDDGEAGMKTLAMALGHGASRFVYAALIASAYLSVAVMVAVGVLAPWGLAVGLTLPLAMKLCRTVLCSRAEKPQEIAHCDVATAQLHLLFGAVLTLSVALQAMLR